MKKYRLLALIIAILVVVTLAAFLAILGSESVPAVPTVTPTTTVSTEDSYKTVDIVYDFALRFPIEFFDSLVHGQEVHGEWTTEVFSMRSGEMDIPLFRIDFGNETAGDWFGVMNIDDETIPVVYTVFALASEEFEAMDERTQEQYFALMNSFNDALNTISADARFSAEKPLDLGETQEVQLAYWTVMLAGNMTVAETNENGTYVAMFYGEVAGERTALYQVRIGDDKAESELGLFEIDGVKKLVSVDSFDLSQKLNWTDEDYSAAYRMMDTINHVIETIMSSAQFSIPVEEPVQAPIAAQ